MDKNKYQYRFLARVVIQAETPLVIGSGSKNFLTDAEILKDFNGLPYIPGTTLSGIVRHTYDMENPAGKDGEGKLLPKKSNDIFGYQNPNKSKEGQGAELIFSEAKLIGQDGKVVDNIQILEGPFYEKFRNLPVRQHCRINEKGVADKEAHGKFDEQVIYKGTRFCFEIEMLSKDEDDTKFVEITNYLKSTSFRIGGGTRKGFGKIKPIAIDIKMLNLSVPEQLSEYLGKSSFIGSEKFYGEFKNNNIEYNLSDSYHRYVLKIKPDDFFCFGSGYGDSEVDDTPITEDEIKWNDDTFVPCFSTGYSDDLKSVKKVLIPSTSVKGAISHRTAYYYNKKNKYYAGSKEAKVSEDNKAVLHLFGGALAKKRGNVIFSDIIEEVEMENKILNHVKIDRFTGGAIAGALFSEKTIYLKSKEKEFSLEIMVKKSLVEDEEANTVIIESLESAMKDVCNGMLPLGGGVNKGNGCFSGILEKDGEVIYSKKK